MSNAAVPVGILVAGYVVERAEPQVVLVGIAILMEGIAIAVLIDSDNPWLTRWGQVRAILTLSDNVRHHRNRITLMTNRLHIDRLVWDAWNREHLTKHEVLIEEAEEVVAADPVVRDTNKGRLQLIGRTSTGRTLVVIVGPVPDETTTYYVFSARPASRKERHYDLQQKGGSTP